MILVVYIHYLLKIKVSFNNEVFNNEVFNNEVFNNVGIFYVYIFGF